MVDTDGNMRGKRGPARLHVAGPNPSAITLRTSKTVSVQTPRAFFGAVLQTAFVITAMPREACFDRQLVAVIGPPAIDSKREYRTMPCPVVADMQRGIKIFRRPGQWHL